MFYPFKALGVLVAFLCFIQLAQVRQDRTAQTTGYTLEEPQAFRKCWCYRKYWQHPSDVYANGSNMIQDVQFTNAATTPNLAPSNDFPNLARGSKHARKIVDAREGVLGDTECSSMS